MKTESINTAEEILDLAYKQIPANARTYCLKFILHAMQEYAEQVALERTQKLQADLEKERREGRREWERLQVSRIDELQSEKEELQKEVEKMGREIRDLLECQGRQKVTYEEITDENTRLRTAIKKFIFDWDRYFSTTPVGQPPTLDDLESALSLEVNKDKP